MSIDFETEIIVIGAGAVGLAIGRALAKKGHEVIILEANHQIGQEISARNSEVIHAGLYYPPDSLKAKLCVKGAIAMYEFCSTHGVTTKNYGKLIIATNDEQVAKIEDLKKRGNDNQVPDLALVSGATLKALEPQLQVAAALHSPLSGIVDSQHYMLALMGDIQNLGGVVALQSRFIKAERRANTYIAHIESGGEDTAIACRHIINAAGHGSHEVASNIEDVDTSTIPPHYLAKGQYFTTAKKPPFSHLIYPVPSGGGLGIHLTLDVAGGSRFGPDIAWVEQMDFSVDPRDAQKFHRSISQYWPDVHLDDLAPAWAGIRPKIVPDGSVFQDFTIHDCHTHGAEGVISLFGIDSPGLTSSLALADYITERLAP